MVVVDIFKSYRAFAIYIWFEHTYGKINAHIELTLAFSTNFFPLSLVLFWPSITFIVCSRLPAYSTVYIVHASN